MLQRQGPDSGSTMRSLSVMSAAEQKGSWRMQQEKTPTAYLGDPDQWRPYVDTSTREDLIDRVEGISIQRR